MKATGIIRRMDDLGRIQIPKEIRRQVFNIDGWSCVGIPFEFFIDGDSIVIKRYTSGNEIIIKGYKENEDE